VTSKCGKPSKTEKFNWGQNKRGQTNGVRATLISNQRG
jgi:hypothetical protein